MAKKRKTKRKTVNAVPKRIAGMKVPKALRRGRVGRLLASPAGQALIVAAAARAGESLIGRDAQPGSAVRKTPAQSQATISTLREGGGESSAAFVYALRQGARAFIAAMQAQQVATRADLDRAREPGPATAGRGEETPGKEETLGKEEILAKKDRGERPDRRTAH